MRLWIVGYFCLTVVQALASAAAVSTTEAAAGSATQTAAVSTTGSAAVNTTGSAAVNTTGAAIVNITAAAFAVNEERLSRVRDWPSDIEPRNAGFANKIRNWFRKLKNRIFGTKKNEATTPTPVDDGTPIVGYTEIIQLDKDDLLFMRRNPKRFYVDVSKLTFDPNKDWGFRLGKWYIIRKESPDQVEESSKRRCPEERVRSTTVESVRHTDDDVTTTPTPGRTTMSSATTTPTAPGETVTVPSTLTDSPHSPKFREGSSTPMAPTASTTVRDSSENDTDNTKRDQSAEVIAPS